jgi:hypothetical protein
MRVHSEPAAPPAGEAPISQPPPPSIVFPAEAEPFAVVAAGGVAGVAPEGALLSPDPDAFVPPPVPEPPLVPVTPPSALADRRGKPPGAPAVAPGVA